MFFSESPECNLINNRLGERFLKCTYCHYECVSRCENSEKKTISLPFRSIIWAPESCCSDWQLYLHPSSCSGPCFWQQSATAFSVSQEECVWAATPVEPAQTVTGTQLCSLFTVNAAQVIKLLIIVVNTDVYFLTTYVVSLTTQSAPSQINLLQFSFIYVAPNHSDSCLKVILDLTVSQRREASMEELCSLFLVPVFTLASAFWITWGLFRDFFECLIVQLLGCSINILFLSCLKNREGRQLNRICQDR